jgi:hypothetical protein
MGGKYTEAQRRASLKWKMNNIDKIKVYLEAYEDKRDKAYFREYYHRTKAHMIFKKECIRMRRILMPSL